MSLLGRAAVTLRVVAESSKSTPHFQRTRHAGQVSLADHNSVVSDQDYLRGNHSVVSPLQGKRGYACLIAVGRMWAIGE